jgi:outer membrane protein OmpA-like peptidoglycan-associated protein
MKKTPKIIIFFCILSFNLSSQNLVKNGSFEDYTVCPTQQKVNGDIGVKGWFVPTRTSPDYYNECCTNKKAGVPENSRGNQYAQEGVGYCGLLVITNDYHSEYLSTKLKKPLKKDHFYCVRFYISLADKSDYFGKDIGVIFSQKLQGGNFNKLTNINLMSMMDYERYSIVDKPKYLNAPVKPNMLIDNTKEWTEVCGNYKAEGGEKYLTIGSFEETPIFYKSKNFNSKSEYYKYGAYVYNYIDNVSVTEISSQEACNCKNSGKQIEQISYNQKNDTAIILKEIAVGENIVLENIYYAFNDSTLLDSSYLELNRLFNALKMNERLKIEIIGHTDNTGTDEYNQQLSLARARAVVKYLTKKGLNEKRLSYKGLGSRQPITTNESEEGRKINRRVEFRIIEK